MSGPRAEPVGVVWARRRARGERVVDIAAEAGCAPVTVYRATWRYGPFLQPRQALRYLSTDDPRAAGWVQRRRHGEPVASIARTDGVAAPEVREATRAHGPYPTPRSAGRVDVDEATVHLWVTARRAGLSLKTIARSAGRSPDLVSRVTAPYGAFDPTTARGQLLGVKSVGRLLGLHEATIIQWRTTGFLPPPAGQTTRGHDLWRPQDVLAWADQVGLPTCPTCGARPKDLTRHHRMRHTTPNPK